MDGEWEPPMIDNPEYKGEWAPKQIDNPKYSGVWVHPMIANPEYEPDDQLYSYDDFGVIGLDLWQASVTSINYSSIKLCSIVTLPKILCCAASSCLRTNEK